MRWGKAVLFLEGQNRGSDAFERGWVKRGVHQRDERHQGPMYNAPIILSPM